MLLNGYHIISFSYTSFFIYFILNAPRTTSASVSRSRRHPVAAERLAGWQEDVGRVSAGRGACATCAISARGEFIITLPPSQCPIFPKCPIYHGFNSYIWDTIVSHFPVLFPNSKFSDNSIVNPNKVFLLLS